MKLPVDVKAIFDAATNIDSAREMTLSVSVLVDETAPGDLVGHVRSAFASASANTRVTLGYLGDDLAQPNKDDNMVVLVAGLNEKMGAHAASVREAGVPVMVVTTLPHLVEEIAQASGTPIPHEDIVSPYSAARGALDVLNFMREGAAAKGNDITSGMFSSILDAGQNAIQSACGAAVSLAHSVGLGKDANATSASAGEKVSASKAGMACAVGKAGAVQDVTTHAQDAAALTQDVTTASTQDAAASEPIVLTNEAKARLDVRMGQWIASACTDARLAFALAFPFVRRPLSVEAVYATSAQNAGVGLVIFIPGADMPIMTLNQAKMLLQIAAAYGKPLDEDRVKELACVVGGAFACRSIARQLVAIVPAAGWAVKAGIGYAGTFAMGKAAIEYFEGGGEVAGLANVVASAKNKAVQAAASATKFVEPLTEKSTKA